MRSLGILIAISFVAVAIFGVFAMDAAKHAVCLAAAGEGIPCPKESPLAFIAFHLSAAKGFSAVVLESLLSLTLLALFLAAFFLLKKLFDFSGAFSHSESHLRHYGEDATFIARRRFLRWLSIHENSPSFV